MRVQGEQRPRIILDTVAEERGIAKAVARQTGRLGLRYVHRGYSEPADTESEFLTRRLNGAHGRRSELVIPYTETVQALNGLASIYSDPNSTTREQMEAKVLHAFYERAVFFGSEGAPDSLNLQLHFESGRPLDERLRDVQELDRFTNPVSSPNIPSFTPRIEY